MILRSLRVTWKSGLNADYTPHARAVGWAIPILIILTAIASFLSLPGCASTGQLIGAGCVTTVCGEICCPNDGKVCPVCWEEPPL